jgi:hypothetical protein
MHWCEAKESEEMTELIGDEHEITDIQFDLE